MDRAASSRRSRRRPSARRWATWAALGIVAGVAAATGWLGWSAYQAQTDLHEARESLSQLSGALAVADWERASKELSRARAATSRAERLTHGPLWAATPMLPVVGDAADVGRGLTASADRLVAGPVTTLVDTATAVRTDRLLSDQGRVAVDRLAKAAPDLTDAAGTLAALRRDVAALPRESGFQSVDRARAGALGQLSTVEETVAGVARLASLAPGMLGAEGPRRYLMVFQNTAEARGTGGIIGAYGVLEARQGQLRVVRVGPNTDLHSFPRPVADLGPRFRERYNGFGATQVWSQANPSPHFPYAARIWLQMWQEQMGSRLDGVIATDPVGLSYLLEATGPVRLPGEDRITAANAVGVTLRDVYARFGDDRRRDTYLQLIAKTVLERVLSGGADSGTLLQQLRLAASDGRFQVFSTQGDIQRELSATQLGGVLPKGPGPLAQLVVNNIAASKLDFYLDRSVRYTALTGCRSGFRKTQVEVQLRNVAPDHGLPAYVTNHLPGELDPGTERLLVSLYLAEGASMETLRLDGKRGLAGVVFERGRPVVTLPLDIAPGEVRTLTVDIMEPASAKLGKVPVQPLVRPQRTVVEVPPC